MKISHRVKTKFAVSGARTHPIGHRFSCIKLSALLLVSMSLALCLPSCVWMKSTDERILEKREKLSHQYRGELTRQMGGQYTGSLDISWNKAVERMYVQNPTLIQADYRIEDARQRQKQVWRDMIPGVNAGISDTFTIGNLGEAFADPSFRINSYLSLGNLLDLPKRVYTNKLYLIGARLQAENVMRQQVIALYRMFQMQRLLRLERKAINYEKELIDSLSGLGGADLLAMRESNKKADEAWKEREQQWRTRVGDFFMEQYGVVNLLPSGIPDITYSSGDLNFSDTGRWGLLQLNLLALEEIAEDGNVLAAYLRYLPRLNLSVSAPPLYSNYNTSQFEFENIRVSPGMNWSMDSRGYIGQQIDRIKRDKVLRDWRKDKRRREEIVKLLEGKKALQEIQIEMRDLGEAIEVYKKAVKAGLVEDTEKAVRTMRKLREREVRLKAKEIEICTEFWLIDESRWKPITRRWLQTRHQRTKQREAAQDQGGNPLKFWSRKKS